MHDISSLDVLAVAKQAIRIFLGTHPEITLQDMLLSLLDRAHETQPLPAC